MEAKKLSPDRLFANRNMRQPRSAQTTPKDGGRPQVDGLAEWREKPPTLFGAFLARSLVYLLAGCVFVGVFVGALLLI